MTNRIVNLAFGASATLVGVTALLASFGCVSGPTLPPPATRVDEVVETLHGTEIVDPYRWLEDMDSAETKAWIVAQDDYAQALLGLAEQRDETRERLTKLLHFDAYRGPYARGERYFFVRRLALEDQRSIIMRESLGDEDIVLVDPLPWSEKHDIRVNISSISANGKILAYRVHKSGSEDNTIRFYDVDRREDLPDELPAARYLRALLLPDGQHACYSSFSEEGGKIAIHRLGTPVSLDRPLEGVEFSSGQMAKLTLSEDGRHLIIFRIDGSLGRTDIYLYEFARGKLTTVAEGLNAHSAVRVADGRIYIATDWEAPLGRVLVASLDQPELEHWQELIGARRGQVLEDMSLVGGKLFLRYLEDVSSRIVTFTAAGEELGEIRFDGIGTVSSINGNWDSTEAFFTFESFHIPRTIYRYDTESGERSILYRPEIPVDPSNYHLQQVWYRSKDRTRVPMFIVHRKGTVLDGKNPTALAAHGSFGVSVTPHFSPTALAWLDGGGMFAIASIRGGGEFGQKWHEAGKRANKQNAVDDLIAAAEWLIREGYCSSDTLAVEGSAHGAIVAAALLVQRPKLAKAVVLGFPLLDMIRYQNDEMGAMWADEFGTAEDPGHFEHLYALSPYHNVKQEVRYPTVLMMTGTETHGIPAYHAMKMTAMLQAKTSSANPILLRYYDESESDDGPMARAIDNITDAHLFIRWQLNR